MKGWVSVVEEIFSTETQFEQLAGNCTPRCFPELIRVKRSHSHTPEG